MARTFALAGPADVAGVWVAGEPVGHETTGREPVEN
jgi:hypothetical protein